MEISNKTLFESVIEASEKATKAEANTDRLFAVAASIKQDLNRVGDKVVSQIAEENKKLLTETELLILKAIAANNNKLMEDEIKPIKRVISLMVLGFVAMGGKEALAYFTGM